MEVVVDRAIPLGESHRKSLLSVPPHLILISDLLHYLHRLLPLPRLWLALVLDGFTLAPSQGIFDLLRDGDRVTLRPSRYTIPGASFTIDQDIDGTPSCRIQPHMCVSSGANCPTPDAGALLMRNAHQRGTRSYLASDRKRGNEDASPIHSSSNGIDIAPSLAEDESQFSIKQRLPDDVPRVPSAFDSSSQRELAEVKKLALERACAIGRTSSIKQRLLNDTSRVPVASDAMQFKSSCQRELAEAKKLALERVCALRTNPAGTLNATPCSLPAPKRRAVRDAKQKGGPRCTSGIGNVLERLRQCELLGGDAEPRSKRPRRDRGVCGKRAVQVGPNEEVLMKTVPASPSNGLSEPSIPICKAPAGYDTEHLRGNSLASLLERIRTEENLTGSHGGENLHVDEPCAVSGSPSHRSTEELTQVPSAERKQERAETFRSCSSCSSSVSAGSSRQEPQPSKLAPLRKSLAIRQKQVSSPSVFCKWDYEPAITMDADQLSQAVRKQVDYYFGCENYTKDNWLRCQAWEEGWTSLKLVSKFNQVKALKCDLQFLRQSLVESAIVEVSSCGEWVRRR